MKLLLAALLASISLCLAYAKEGDLLTYPLHFASETLEPTNREIKVNSYTKVGNGWRMPHVFSDGHTVIYAIDGDGNLRWYKHYGGLEANDWHPESQAIVGTGWGWFKHVFFGGDTPAGNQFMDVIGGDGQNYEYDEEKKENIETYNGNAIIYAVTKNGDLLWYQHQGRNNGVANWEYSPNGVKVGNGWDHYKQVFSAGNGVIYGITEEGDLHWYRHTGWFDGKAEWANGGHPVRVGEGWNFKLVFSQGSYFKEECNAATGKCRKKSASSGVIYGVRDNGDLYWYRHVGWEVGKPEWANGGSGKKIGERFYYNQMFANMYRIYAVSRN